MATVGYNGDSIGNAADGHSASAGPNLDCLAGAAQEIKRRPGNFATAVRQASELSPAAHYRPAAGSRGSSNG
jgi:hypothetical protein